MFSPLIMGLLFYDLAMTSEAIQLFVPKFRTDETLEAIREALDKHWSGMGFLTNRFEEEWASYTKSDNALFLNSATAALHLAVEVLGKDEKWGVDAEIITTPLTFVSTNHAILYAGYKPVFADIDSYLCLDPKSVEEKISKNTKAVMFVGHGGTTGQLESIVKICKENNLKLIIDAAHMAGTKLNGIEISSFGDVTCYSFQAVKNLPTADSGAIVFKEQRHSATARKLSWLGINKDTFQRSNKGNYSWNYEVEDVGYKYNGNPVIAAMASVGLRYLDLDNQARRENYQKYADLLEPVKDKGTLISNPENCLNSQHLIQILVPDRDKLIEAMNNENVFPGVHYRDNTEYKVYKYGHNPKSFASKASDQVLSLPNHLFLKDSDIELVSDLVCKHLQR